MIVPVHGTERYLRECLDSLAAQRVEGLQVIVVNDGSPDESQTIIDEFCRRLPNFECIVQEGSGVAEARNAGLLRATGEYVTFLDSDDVLPVDAYYLLLSAASRTDADVCTGIAESFRGERRWINVQMRELFDCICARALLSDHPALARDASPCNKIISREVIDSEGLRFPAGISLREDLHFVLRAYAASSHITVVPSTVYGYRVRDASEAPSLTQMVSPKAVEDLLWVASDLARRLAGRVSDAVVREHHKGIAANIAYRLGPALRDGRHEDAQRLFREVHSFLARCDPAALGELPRVRQSLLMLCVQRGELDLARECASETNDATLTSLLMDAGLGDHPGFDRAIGRARAGTQPRGRSDVTHDTPAVDLARNSWPRDLVARLAGQRSARARREAPKDVWLVGERFGMSAEDTGYHFFAWCRRKHPDLPVYFVTRKDAVGRERAEELGNVLTYGTAGAYEAVLRARVLVYSDSCRDFVDPWRPAARRLRRDAIGCFLQHGVIGLSGMGQLYEKSQMLARQERVDAFVASSERERQLIVERLGFSPDEIIVSGLSRFDALAEASRPRREILVAPTWRDWLRWGDFETVARSDYFATWQTVIADRELHALLEDQDLRLVFVPHFGMTKHAHLFHDTHPRVEVARPGDGPLQARIKRASLLVTDYSSVSFDVAYRRLPVVYYPFDSERFAEARGGLLLDPDTDLPGRTVAGASDLVETIAEYARRGFELEPALRARIDRVLPAPDGRCCERLFDALSARL